MPLMHARMNCRQLNSKRTVAKNHCLTKVQSPLKNTLPPSSPLKGLTIRHRGCRIQNPLTSCLAPGKAGLDVVLDKRALLGCGDRAVFVAGGGGGSGAAGKEFAFISPVEPT
ncbi:hypothetical protein ACHAW6_002715 [Cyclotella cf. meneghiniana]